ncbi:MAG: hypothetical protein ABSC23_17430, partial [Bryobacteraceae bacterium]
MDGTTGSVAAPCCPGAGGGSGVQVYATVPSVASDAYWPHGAVKTLNLGNGVTEASAYNSRLQMTEIAAGNLLDVHFYPCTGDQPECTTNNGNILREKILIGGQLKATQDYGYDGVNRLALAVENA